MSHGQIATRLKVARQKAKLTQQALADRIGVTRSLISQWENGVVTKAGAGNLEAAARELRVPLSYLLHGTPGHVSEETPAYLSQASEDLARYWTLLTEEQRKELTAIARRYAEQNLQILKAFGVDKDIG